jgi:hypothetical protein
LNITSIFCTSIITYLGEYDINIQSKQSVLWRVLAGGLLLVSYLHKYVKTNSQVIESIYIRFQAVPEEVVLPAWQAQTYSAYYFGFGADWVHYWYNFANCYFRCFENY